MKTALLFVVLPGLACGAAYVMPKDGNTASNTPASPSQQAIGSASQSNGAAPPAGVPPCPAICGVLAGYGPDAQDACTAYCTAEPNDTNLCDYCPSGDFSIDGMLGCLDAYNGCVGYHCITPSASTPPSPWTAPADAGVYIGTDAGTPPSWACVANMPGGAPFVCVLLNSPDCAPPQEFCVNVPLTSWAPGPDYYSGSACDPSNDPATWCSHT